MMEIAQLEGSDRAVLFDARWRGAHGIARFSSEVYRRIPGLVALESALPPFNPLDPLWTSGLLALKRARGFFTPGFNAPLWSRLPVILTVHDLNYVRCSVNSDPLRRAYFSYLVRPACRRAFRVLTVSEFSRGQILEWSGVRPERVVNVSAGVDARFRPDGPPREMGCAYILAAANGRPHKNIPRLLRAFAASGLSRDLKLVIFGNLEKEGVALIDELGLEDATRLLGRVADEDLPALYRGAVAFCMPSLFEGFGLPVIEAMACGVPVLASTATSLPEVAGSAAVLVDPTDVDAIADGMRRIVSEGALRAQLASRGLARSREFSWARTAQTIEAVLDELD